MVSQTEMLEFILVYSEAEAQAKRDNRACGYLLLWEGLRRAETSWVMHREALVDLWQRGIQRFQSRYPTEGHPK